MELEWGQITISSIFSLLLGVIIGHWLALGRDKRKEFVEAGKEFRAAFVDLQRLLASRHANHPGGDEFQKTWKLMAKHYSKAVEAKVRFEPMLPDRKKVAFGKAWNKLWNVDGEIPSPNISAFRTSEDHLEELAMRDSVLAKVNQIFKFTK